MYIFKWLILIYANAINWGIVVCAQVNHLFDKGNFEWLHSLCTFNQIIQLF